MERIIKYLNYLIYWLVILIPFFVSIAPAPVNILMVFLIVSFLAKKALKGGRLFTNTVINVPLLFLFLATCASLLNSINYSDSLKGGIFRLMGYLFVFFILAEEVKEPVHIKRIVFAICAGIILASLDGVWQVLTGRDFIRGYAPVINIGLARATAAFKDSNLLGIYLSAFAPLIFGLNLYYFRNRRKMFFGFVSIIALIGIILTYSRPTLLAIYMAIFFLGIFRKDKILIGVLIIFTIFSPFLLPKSVKEWAKLVRYNPVVFMCNHDRVAVYRNSLNMIKEHPFVGLGANTYMKNYKKYKDPTQSGDFATPDYMYAHNNFLHMAAEIGLIGLVIFIWLLYKLFKGCADIYKKLADNYLKLISLSLSACLIAFLVNGLTESSLYYSRVAIIFWYLMGLSLALSKFTPQQKDTP